MAGEHYTREINRLTVGTDVAWSWAQVAQAALTAELDSMLANEFSSSVEECYSLHPDFPAGWREP